jgi:CcmD family protein
MRRPGRSPTLLISVVGAGIIWSAAPVFSQQPDPAPAAPEAVESRAQAFQAVSGAREEGVSGAPLMLAAYGVVWLLVLAYVMRIGLLQKRTERELVRLEESVRRDGERGDVPGS